MKTTFFDLSEVLLEDDYFVNAFEKEVAYLRSFDMDRLLAGFRETAGLADGSKKRYGGWESMLIGGHTLGHYLTAASQAYASAGIDKDDQKDIYQKLSYLVKELLVCQKNSKGKPGFLFGALILDPENVELQFDQVEKNRTNIITEAWVPWYTMHKILDGLVRCYELTGLSEALTVASGIGDWAYERAIGWDKATRDTVISIEYGGMNDALYELYKCTKSENHLTVAHIFDEDTLFEAVMSGGKDVLTNKHANTTIPKFVGALNRYMVTGEERYLTYVEAFFDMVLERHTYVTGGNSEWEHFGEDYVLDMERTNCNNETCNTYNMLKLSRGLFAATGKRKYADYYENTLINAILSSQNPVTGMSMYFQPMATGYFKVYGTGFDKFWCCTGSGMENFTKLNDSIYYQFEDGAVVNLYISSTLYDEKNKITIRQHTNFLLCNEINFTFNIDERVESVHYAMRFRIPDWTSGYHLSVNGEAVDCLEEEGYLVVDRAWKDQDQAALSFDIKMKAVGLPDSKSVFAFKYGPILLSADLGYENEISTTTGVDVTIPKNKLSRKEYLIIPKKYASAGEYVESIEEHFRLVDEKLLTFELWDADEVLRFTPHFSKIEERYGIYWYFFTEKEAQIYEESKVKERINYRLEHLTDTVQPGYGQYENDEIHDMKEQNSVGNTSDGTSRYAEKGGFFTYNMKVKSQFNHVLEAHVSTLDDNKPLKIFVEDTVVFDAVLNYNTQSEENFISDTEYVINIPISKELIEQYSFFDKDETLVSVKICGTDTESSARLMNFLYMFRE